SNCVVPRIWYAGDAKFSLDTFHSNYVLLSSPNAATYPRPAIRRSTMSRTLRNVLIAVGVLIVLLIVIPFLIPVNQFRGTIEEKASVALGRKVQLGNLSLSLLRGGLSAENLSIGDDPKFSSSPFLTAKSLNVGVELMPLIFSRQVNVTSVVIKDPEVTLLRNPAGDWNCSTLGASPAKAEKVEAAAAQTPPAESGAKPSTSAPNVSVKKIELSNGKI